VAADCQELVIPQYTTQQSTAQVGERLDPQFAAKRHTTRNLS